MIRILRLLCLLLFLLPAVSLLAASKDPDDYPLRLHVFSRSETTFYRHRVADEAKGDGRANLFENGEPRGVDFSFDCAHKIKASFGFETYPAKWKKRNVELVVLFPVFGKADAHFTCNLKTQTKDYAYFMQNGRLGSEPVAEYKAWMAAHDYDPEHGRNAPKFGSALAGPAVAPTQR